MYFKDCSEKFSRLFFGTFPLICRYLLKSAMTRLYISVANFRKKVNLLPITYSNNYS